MLFPFRTSSIFRSRWIALLWAAGMVWVAVDVAGSAQRDKDPADNATDATGASIDAAQMKQAERLLQQFGR